MKVEFNTMRFEEAHGKTPSGRGGWAFCPERHYNECYYLDFTFWASGTYREAKASATAHFLALGETEVVVCS